MKPVDFLINEAENLQFVLDQTLRYDYGLDGSREFYEECCARLKHIKSELKIIDAADVEVVCEVAKDIDDLSELICRIERSSLGEYSWPFVEEFKEISKEICTEIRDVGPPRIPKVHVIAEGGLSSYSIYSDPNRELGKRRIFTIVFPRTLKHYVLLHTILGHEVGHAIYNLPKVQGKLDDIFLTHFVTPNKIFKDQKTVVQWLYSANAPEDVRGELNKLEIDHSIGSKDFFFAFASYDSWIQEFLCDFIGLLMFGPSFLAAHTDLLYSSDPNGDGIHDDHPFTALRVNILLTAAEVLGYDQWVFDQRIQSAVNDFWKDLFAKRQTDPWYDIFPKSSIKQTIEHLKEYLATFEGALYPKPAIGEIEKLVTKILDRCPPVGYQYDNGPQCSHVDFRQIIFAGWIAHAHKSTKVKKTKITFSEINRLCEHGIMQQASIKLMLNNKNKRTRSK